MSSVWRRGGRDLVMAAGAQRWSAQARLKCNIHHTATFTVMCVVRRVTHRGIHGIIADIGFQEQFSG
jgi:hypothetical protein